MDGLSVFINACILMQRHSLAADWTAHFLLRLFHDAPSALKILIRDDILIKYLYFRSRTFGRLAHFRLISLSHSPAFDFPSQHPENGTLSPTLYS